MMRTWKSDETEGKGSVTWDRGHGAEHFWYIQPRLVTLWEQARETRPAEVALNLEPTLEVVEAKTYNQGRSVTATLSDTDGRTVTLYMGLGQFMQAAEQVYAESKSDTPAVD